MSMKENLFSYGTLQKDTVQLALFGRLLHGSKDRLNDHQLASVEIKDGSFLSKGEQNYQLTVIPSTGNNDSIEGMVFEISAEELLLADNYEPAEYKRVIIALASGKKAWIYLAVEMP